MPFYVPESAMVIFAHPDDIEFGPAGTLARWAQAGARISYVLCTSGEVGIGKKKMTREEACELREAEQRNAAEIVGAQEVIFLREPDGMLQPTVDLRRRLVREIRRFRPEVVICGDPTVVWAGTGYINHPDHRAAATAALDAAFPAAGQPNLFQELENEDLYAHKPRKVYVYSWLSGDYHVDISETIETKIQALKAHESQMNEAGEFDAAKMIRDWAAEIGQGHEMQYAEAFRVVTLESDKFWEETRGLVRPT